MITLNKAQVMIFNSGKLSHIIIKRDEQEDNTLLKLGRVTYASEFTIGFVKYKGTEIYVW